MVSRAVALISSVVLAMAVVMAFAASVALAAPGSTSVGSCRSAAGRDACLGLRSAPFVSPAQADRVILALWNARENARVDRDTPLLLRLDAGSAALTDVAIITSVRCGCGPFYSTPGRREFGHAVIYLPRQDHYPLFFAADVTEVLPTSSSSSASVVQTVMIVTRASGRQPWRIAFQFYGANHNATSEYGPPTLDRDGYDVTPPRPSNTAIRGWFAGYVEYLNELKQTGKQPSSTRFAPGPLTSGNHLEAHPNGYTYNGITYTHTFKEGPFGGPWVFSAGGTPIICGDIAEYSLARPSQRGQVLVYPVPARGRVDWDWELPPGSYTSSTALYEWPACILPEPDGKLGVDGPSTGGYPIQDTGARAQPS